MVPLTVSLLALSIALAAAPAQAVTPLGFEDGGNTLVSAMMVSPPFSLGVCPVQDVHQDVRR